MWKRWSESDDASPPPRRCSSTVGRAPSRSSWTRLVSPSRRSSCCCGRRRPGRPPPASGSPPHRCWSTAGHTVQSEEVSREQQVGGHVEVTSCHFWFCWGGAQCRGATPTLFFSRSLLDDDLALKAEGSTALNANTVCVQSEMTQGCWSVGALSLSGWEVGYRRERVRWNREAFLILARARRGEIKQLLESPVSAPQPF